MVISAQAQDYQELNRMVRESEGDVVINDCFGERFIGTAAQNRTIEINGTPGNALGCYLDGANIIVNGNAQDAVGDTMNDGRIVINGSAGDALGYAMRGGEIFVKGDSGYRTGIHMKEYGEKKPVIVVGGKVGSFCGEYLAGGMIIILGLGAEGVPLGNFTGTGMHGGKIFVRSSEELKYLPVQVLVKKACQSDFDDIKYYVDEYKKLFGDSTEFTADDFYVCTPNASNPYKTLYAAN